MGALLLGRLLRLADLADTALALSLEATARYDGGGNLSPFSAAVQAAKAVDGQAVSAGNVRRLVRGGWLEQDGRDASVQDALSFRAARRPTAPSAGSSARSRKPSKWSSTDKATIR